MIKVYSYYKKKFNNKNFALKTFRKNYIIYQDFILINASSIKEKNNFRIIMN